MPRFPFSDLCIFPYIAFFLLFRIKSRSLDKCARVRFYMLFVKLGIYCACNTYRASLRFIQITDGFFFAGALSFIIKTGQTGVFFSSFRFSIRVAKIDCNEFIFFLRGMNWSTLNTFRWTTFYICGFVFHYWQKLVILIYRFYYVLLRRANLERLLYFYSNLY